MKHSNTILHIVFGFAIVVLFILVAKNNQSNSKQQSSEPLQIAVKDSSGNIVIKPFPVAYIIVDSLMRNYLYYKKIEGQYQTLVKQEDSKLQQQGQAFEQEVYQLQMQVQKGLITSRDAQMKEQELQMRQQKLMEWQQSKQQELANKEQLLMKELLDSVQVAIQFHNADNKYEIVLNNAFNSSVLYAKEHLNITDTILKIMNERFSKSTTKK
ncbi:MAG TPA: OmpH family outer membrane protein [Bacteroidales bacterium]|nr:MAG: Outer membrane protein (OmpH-like) [Bacteroidetes bacterium ADurb.Bin217]HOS84479.1 OmpH family outer membrane protein [Bacteroidales bacterium]HPM12195.1 OmpH family outer membrane protein [Bacteroidales bacterium]